MAAGHRRASWVTVLRTVSVLIFLAFRHASAAGLLFVGYGTNTVGDYDAGTGVPIHPELVTGVANPVSLALSGTSLYILSADSNTVSIHNAASGVATPTSTFELSGTSTPNAIAVAGGRMYIASKANGTIAEYSAVTGIAINPTFISGLDSPSAIAVSGAFLYVASSGSGTIGQYSAATGATLKAAFISGLNAPSALAIADGLLYVANSGNGVIGEYSAPTGAAIEPSIISGLVAPSALAVRGSELFVSSSSSGAVARYIASTGVLINSSFVSDVPVPASLAVSPFAPVITSALRVTGTVGFSFNYRITAKNQPTAYGAKNLPANLKIDTSTGIISGRPLTAGTFTAILGATNLGGTGSAFLRIVVKPLPVPVINSARDATATVGVPFAYRITARNLPTSFDATDLPPGLVVDASTGLISGTPTMTGTFAPTISAINSSGTGSATLLLNVKYHFAEVAGSYDGLASSGTSSDAFVALSLAPNGAFTGRLTAGNKRYPIRGTFAGNGSFDGMVKSGAVTLDLALSITAPPPEISGSIAVTGTAGTQIYAFTSDLLGVFTRKTTPPGLAGRYTIVFPPLSGTDPALPHVPGYATMTVGVGGSVHLSGKLGDGTPIIAGGRVTADSTTWTLFTPFSSRSVNGSAAGVLTFEPLPNSDADGTLDIVETQTPSTGPALPVDFQLSIMAAKYTAPPLSPGTATLVLTGGDLPSTITANFTVTARGKPIATTLGEPTLSLSPATGLFSGTFLNPATSLKTPYSGVIYQKPTATGAGHFLTQPQPGSVQISR